MRIRCPSTLRVCLVFSLGLLPTCCSRESEIRPSEVERWDSAGVEIVESLNPLWGERRRWHIDPKPLVDLTSSGAASGHESGTDPHIFDRVRGILRLSDGSFVVANSGSHEVRYYSPRGDFRTAIGREGEGPGEFTGIRDIALLTSDTLLVLDYDARVTVLDSAGGLVRVFALPRYTIGIHALGDDDFVSVSGFPSMSVYQGYSGMIWEPGALWRYDLGGALIDSIGETAGFEEYIFSIDGGPSGAAVPLFGKSAQVATGDNSIVFGNADRMQVEEMSPDGEILRILRIAEYPLELARETIDAERKARLRENPHPMVRRIEAQLPDPAMRPAYSRILVDSDAVIWLRPFRGLSEQDGPTGWEVLDSAGRWLGSVEVPVGFSMMGVEGDVVVGVWTDSLGVEHPRAHRLVRN